MIKSVCIFCGSSSTQKKGALFKKEHANIAKNVSNNFIVRNSKKWKYILNKSKLSANKKHVFKEKQKQK